MDRGLYIAASGMVTEMVRQDQLANDLANASTPGYKADRSNQREFGALLLHDAATGAPVGPLGLGVAIDRTTTDLSPQALRETGDPLDFAVEGDGYFAVQTAQGVRYARNGRFMADARGRLVTASGDAVLGRDGRPVTVGADGKVDPAKLRVATLTGVQKAGDGLFTGRPAAGQAGSVRAGALEGSGTEPAKAMVDLIASMRAFESGQKVITTIDETLSKAASQVASLNG
jgi:flagellar basal-body rod protein FlgF